jgi:sulfate adenylyltransferase
MPTTVPPPHGGTLVQLIGSHEPQEHLEARKREAAALEAITLGAHELGQLELLLVGAYSPLEGYMGREAFASVCANWRLPNGLAWALPVVLGTSTGCAAALNTGQQVALRDPEGVNLAIMTITELWSLDGGETSGLSRDFATPDTVFIAGTLEGLELPVRYGFEHHYLTPALTRSARGTASSLVIHSAQTLHRFQVEHAQAQAAARKAEIVMQPDDGGADFDSFVRAAHLRAHRATVHEGLTGGQLSLLPYSSHYMREREQLQHAIVAQNFGFNACVYYDDRQRNEALSAVLAQRSAELEVECIEHPVPAYDPEHGSFVIANDEPSTNAVCVPNQGEVATLFAQRQALPEWFSYPGVVAALRSAYRPANEQGLVIFFTGLSGSGKSTVARYVFGQLLEDNARPATLLDGDVVRQHLSSELGFSKEHRDLNIRRIGYVATEIAKNGGVAVCAPIAPYAQTRAAVQEMVERNGVFIEIHVSTPLEVCEARDRKGLYALARAGKIKEFTGISDPYEIPINPALRIDTTEGTAAEAGQTVLKSLRDAGYLS